ncbi:hypothetical protein CHUAL_002112 [Chamberlinius hualienensis]
MSRVNKLIKMMSVLSFAVFLTFQSPYIDGLRFQPMLRSCQLEQPPSNVRLLYDGKTFWPTPGLQFAHGTLLHARCETVGLYKFIGNSTIRCRNGHWEKRLPSCLPTTYLTNFTDNKVSPSILYQIASGSAAPSDSGELIVYPGSIVHLDCIYQRKDGNPQWSWTPIHRQYPTGWAVSRQDRDWKYRLSIYYARPHDSGTFTCATPHGLTNSMTISIKAIECSTIRVNTSTTRVINEGYRLNDKVKFLCSEGHLLAGVAEISCLWTGKWSDEPPTCEALYCPELVPSDDKLQILASDTSHKGKAQFRCPKGHRIDGPSEVVCLNGSWSDIAPKCEAVYCEPPQIPNNSQLFGGGEKYLVGDKIRYECEKGYVLIGESYVFCVGPGVWDNPFPSCKAVCESRGKIANGYLDPISEYYEIGESVTVTCDEEFVVNGAQTLQCLGPGNWSNPIPECKPFVF